MSNLLPDLASWALRGAAANPNPEVDAAPSSEPTMTPEELRAQRLARLGASMPAEPMEGVQVQDATTSTTTPKESTPPVKTTTPPLKEATQVTPSSSSPLSTKASAAVVVERSQPPLVKKAAEPAPRLKKAKAAHSRQRQKEQLLAKCLQVQLHGSSTPFSDTVVVVDTGSIEISALTIAEIIAVRLSTSATTGEGVISYLGRSYLRTLEALRSSPSKSDPVDDNELEALLQEILQQVVSYAATCVVEPDVFPAVSSDIPQQIVTALLQPDLLWGGATQSFFAKLMDDVQQQDASVLATTVHAVLDLFCSLLLQTDSVLETITVNDTTPLTSCTPTHIVTALTSMCSLHKGVAAHVATYPYFLLPPVDGSTTSSTPPPFVAAANPGATSTMSPLLQLLSGGGAAMTPMQRLLGRWQPGTGLALEHGTLLGLCLRVGIPKTNNPAFTTLPPSQLLRQSQPTIESLTRAQREKLSLHQGECYNFIMALLKVKAAKAHIMTWFTDVLRVNAGASALRPDTSKVSSTNLLLHVSMMLLRLCQPFVKAAPEKQHLIDPGFLVHGHSGVLARTGEHAVPRLGGETLDDTVLAAEYQPKNAFIPFCFFFCAHALHLSIVPALQQNELLLRHISHYHHEVLSRDGNVDAMQNDPRFAALIARQRSEDVALFQEDYLDRVLEFGNFTAHVLFHEFMERDARILAHMPEEFVSDICDILVSMVTLKPQRLAGHDFRGVFHLFVHLLSPQYATMVRNYNLRAQLGDVLHDIFLPRPTSSRQRDVPSSIALDPMAGGQSFLLSDAYAQETLAPSLLLLYGEVEHTGYYDKMTHRAKIASLIHYLWESSEHRPAFRRITQNQASFIKFANGIMNETNTLIATVMQKLPEIREAQEKMKNANGEWNRLSEDERSQITSRLDDNERDVKSSLPLCNKTLQMFGYLNTDSDIRNLFLLPELCSRLVTMLLHVLTKLVGSKGLDLKVDNPEQYDFRPKEMLRDLCAIFALFAASDVFQEECAKSGCDPNLLRSAVRTCRRLHLLEGESMEALASLPDAVAAALEQVVEDEALFVDAPEEFLDEILSTFMKDPVRLPSGHFVDRSTIQQHLLNDSTDPFSREPLEMDQVEPAVELQERIQAWLNEQRLAKVAEDNDPMDL